MKRRIPVCPLSSTIPPWRSYVKRFMPPAFSSQRSWFFARTTYAYDCDGNISHLETKTESAVLLSFSYQYDGNGNRTAKTGTQGLTAGSSALQPAAIDISYRYDVRGQLSPDSPVSPPFSCRSSPLWYTKLVRLPFSSSS